MTRVKNKSVQMKNVKHVRLDDDHWETTWDDDDDDHFLRNDDDDHVHKITTTKQNKVFVIYLRVVYNLFYQILSDYQGSLVLLVLLISTLRSDHVTEFYLFCYYTLYTFLLIILKSTLLLHLQSQHLH